MRKIYTLALIILVVLPMFSQELPVSFKSGEFKLTKNNIFSFTSSDPYRILTFKNLPTKEVKQEIKEEIEAKVVQAEDQPKKKRVVKKKVAEQ